MAKIISISLSEDLLEELERLQKEMGFSGKSETIRAGIRMLVSDDKERAKLTGVVDAVLLAIHKDEYVKDISELAHMHAPIIKTQIHHHLENEKCLEIYVLNGQAEKIRAAARAFQKNKKIDLSKLIPT